MKPKEIIAFNSMEIHFCLDAADTNKELTMFKYILPAGAKEPVPHYHENFDETVFGLSGAVTYIVDGKTMEIGEGDALFIPRGAVHSFMNKKNEPTEFLCFTNPGALGPDYFYDLASVLGSHDQQDIKKIKDVMLKHGLFPVIG